MYPPGVCQSGESCAEAEGGSQRFSYTCQVWVKEAHKKRREKDTHQIRYATASKRRSTRPRDRYRQTQETRETPRKRGRTQEVKRGGEEKKR